VTSRGLAIPWLAVVLLLFGGLAAPADAVNANSCARGDVITAINNAPNGDTVTVPAGTCTWSTTVTLPSTKDLTLKGAGMNATVINCPAPYLDDDVEVQPNCLVIPNSRTYVISGFHFIVTSPFTSPGAEILLHRVDAAVPGKYHHVHDNTFTFSGLAYGSIGIWGEPATNCDGPTHVHPSVLYDHNAFNNVRVLAAGTACAGATEFHAQHRLWAQTPPVGSWPEMVYVENNTFTSIAPPFPADGGLINFVDTNYGGRYVARFNTIASGPGVRGAYAEVHGIQGLNRASQWKEIYKNTHAVGFENFFGLAFIRSGSGVLWGNRVGANAQEMRLDIQRVWDTEFDSSGVIPPGRCNGSSNWDGNAHQTGYPCRDQIGRMKDNALWSPGAPYAQDLAPFYFWDNLKGASTQYVPALNSPEEGVDQSPWIMENRDWYTQNTSFNGTSGVGVGVLASRPSTCTTGVAYWATNQGSWNTTLALNASGRLDKCVATNTWQAGFYVPYTYPHPLISGFAGTRRIRDFNGDDTSDILWRNTSTGDVALWLITGGAVSGSAVIGNGGDWVIAGTGDFNRDGTSDILWRHASGSVAFWSVKNGAVIGSGIVGNGGTTWTIAGVGDFNGNGYSDILWRDTSGAVAVWLVENGAVTGSGVIGNVATSWTIEKVGDFNGDGKADILWRNTSTGDVTLWLMNGLAVASTTALGNVGAVWMVAGVGDFNGDLTTDILWRNTSTGDVTLWLMNGGAVTVNGFVANVATNWTIDKVGDFNGDGKADILWRDTSGTVALWLMNGLAIAGTGNLGTVTANWVTQ